MLNLHFANMPRVPNTDIQVLLERTYNNYRPFYKYLSSAKYRIEAQALMLAWEGPIDPEIIRNRTANGSMPSEQNIHQPAQRKTSAMGFWIRLREIDAETPEEVFDEFFDADFISDKAKAGRGDIEVLDREPEIDAICVSRLPAAEKVYIHPNTWNLYRELMALENIRQSPHPAHRPLISLAEGYNNVRWEPVAAVSPINWRILVDDDFAGVDEQRDFVEKALGTPDFAILEGPPGSGKTVTICELILQEIELGHRVLLCASTHVAVDNVLEKLVDLGWMERSVVAVRIASRDFDVSEQVSHLLLKNRLETERNELKKKLKGIARRTPAQDYLLKALEEDGEKVLQRLILDSANLVCGTTIGILKHPDIAVGLVRPAFPEFDTLIVDEASKTPFQEFLVPALYAKKWVLVGDVNQLSPFVNNVEVEANLAGILDERESRAILPVFKAFVRARRKKGEKRSFLLCDPDPKVREWAVKQAEALGIPTVQLSPQTIDSGDLGPLWADLMVADTKDLTVIGRLLPLNVQVLSETVITSRLERRMAYWRVRHPEEADNEEQMEREEKTWASEIGWRLIRQFELRRRPEEAKRYAADVDALLPKWLDEKEMNRISYEVNSIKRVALPSILEMLQVGFEREQMKYEPTAITHGLPTEVLSKRHAVLTYQHRMHPDISRFPRENIYEGQSLRDPPNIASQRSLNIGRYGARSVWIHVLANEDPNANRNFAEADIIMDELQTFLSWATSNPKKKNGTILPWDVAVLTFYLAQESELRRRLRSLFKSWNRQHFKTGDGRVRVSLGSVDRFQGHEADFVLLSFVRDPLGRKSIGFLDSPHRLNVAITRGRFQLVLVGNCRGFARQWKSDLLRRLGTQIPIAFSYSSKEGRSNTR
jgi:hypothetical protein